MIANLQPYLDYKESGLAPKGRLNTSPGQRPGSTDHTHIQALKGRANGRWWVALSGLGSLRPIFPGRGPGLVWDCPVGARNGGPQ